MLQAARKERAIMNFTGVPVPRTIEPAAEEFCARHDLAATLAQAIRLAEECFPSLQSEQVLHRQDPENDEEWLSLRIFMGGTVEDALKSYEQFIQKWVEIIPWPERGMVRLSYNVA
jgi:hypothetical protein